MSFEQNQSDLLTGPELKDGWTNRADDEPDGKQSYLAGGDDDDGRHSERCDVEPESARARPMHSLVRPLGEWAINS